MILAIFYQKFLPKSKIWVSQTQRTVFFYTSPAVNLHLEIFTKLHDSSLKNTKFSSFWGSTPPQSPPVRASTQLMLTHHQVIPPMSKMDLPLQVLWNCDPLSILKCDIDYPLSYWQCEIKYRDFFVLLHEQADVTKRQPAFNLESGSRKLHSQQDFEKSTLFLENGCFWCTRSCLSNPPPPKKKPLVPVF